MIKFFLLFITILIFSTALSSQKIRYTDNRLFDIPDYKYNIIGSVNNNILIWKTNINKHFSAEIFIYDNAMKLISTINTAILKSDINPNPQFLVAGNSFFVFYEYQKKDIFLYRLARFDENGKIQAIQTLDSINTNDKPSPDETILYTILQTENNKTVCFVKMMYDTNHYALKFNCHYIGQEIIQKSFAFSFDGGHEKVTDINIDDNKNILIVTTAASVSSTSIKFIRKNFSDETMLVSQKTINGPGFKEDLIHVTQTPNGFMIFGVLKNKDRNDTMRIKTYGLFVWQTTSVLDDLLKDTIICKADTVNALTYVENISSGKIFPRIFLLRYAIEAGVAATGVKVLPDTWYDVKSNYSMASQSPSYFLYDNSNLKYYNPENMMVQTIPTAMEQVKDFFVESSRNTIELFRLDSANKIVWDNIFTDNIDTVTKANLNNAKIITGNEAIHIIYETQIKNQSKSLNHLIIYGDGTFTKTFYTTWDAKYSYYLSEGVVTVNNDLIVAAIKGKKLKFAKIKIE